MSLAGNFNTTRAAGKRVSVTGGGKVNHGNVIAGAPGGSPFMIGGDRFNAVANANVPTT